MKFYRFKGLLQENGWTTPCYVGVDDTGNIAYLDQNPPDFHLLDDTAAVVSKYPDVSLGFGVHSMRAVDHRDLVSTFQKMIAFISSTVHT